MTTKKITTKSNKKAVKAKKKTIKVKAKVKKKIVFVKAKKKVIKKKKVAKPAPTPEQLFGDWWEKVASKKVNKIEKRWIKENEPNDPNEDGGGDHWCVNEMMHNGDAHEMTAEIAERVFMQGYNKEKWELTMSDGLFCELDDVICEAYEAGKKARK